MTKSPLVDNYINNFEDESQEVIEAQADIIKEYVDGLADDGSYDDTLEELNSYLLDDWE